MTGALDGLPALLAMVGMAGLAAGYGRGRHETLRMLAAHGRRPRAGERWRAAAVYGAVAVLALALVGPLPALARGRPWGELTAEALLGSAVAPLLVLGAPWLALARALPARPRRGLLRAVRHRPSLAPLRTAWRAGRRLTVSWVLFNGALLGWHLPGPYAALAAHPGLRLVEAASLLGTATLFWLAVVDSRPLRARAGYLWRAAGLIGCAGVAWGLAAVLEGLGRPLYPVLGPAPAGLASVPDQQLAAAVILLPAGLPFSAVFLWAVHCWLRDQERVRLAPGVYVSSVPALPSGRTRWR